MIFKEILTGGKIQNFGKNNFQIQEFQWDPKAEKMQPIRLKNKTTEMLSKLSKKEEKRNYIGIGLLNSNNESYSQWENVILEDKCP